MSAAAIALPVKPRILVIIVARFGDTLLVTPILRALKQAYAGARLTVVCHPKTQEVLWQLSSIDRLRTFTKQSAPWRGRLPDGERYDLALVYSRDTQLMAYARRVSPVVIGFADSNGRADPALTHAVAPPVAHMQAVAERALLLQPLGLSLARYHLDYQVSLDEQAWARQWLTDAGLAEKRLVGLQLQSFASKAYRDWPLAYFRELAERLLAMDANIQLLLLGGPEGSSNASALAEQLGPRARSVAGQVSMRQNAALLQRLSLYVGVDTGPTHLAGALDVPMVALYHCFHRGRWLAPLEHAQLTVIEHPRSDAECGREAPMAEISVEVVWAAVMKILGIAA